jgi:outer membrane immunogenic protein
MAQRQWTGALRWAACGAIALMATASLAHADGMPRAPRSAPVAGSTWQGFYIGTHAGLANGQTTGDPPGIISTDFDINGALYGVQVGYNLQFGTTVLGIEGAWSDSTIHGSSGCVAVLGCKRDLNWVASVVGRAGMAFDRTLVYGMGGVAWADVDASVNIVGVTLASASETHTGWVAGFGFEHMLTSHISTRIEYAHFDLGSATHNLAPVTTSDKVDVKFDTIRLGVNIKLTN